MHRLAARLVGWGHFGASDGGRLGTGLVGCCWTGSLPFAQSFVPFCACSGVRGVVLCMQGASLLYLLADIVMQIFIVVGDFALYLSAIVCGCNGEQPCS